MNFESCDVKMCNFVLHLPEHIDNITDEPISSEFKQKSYYQQLDFPQGHSEFPLNVPKFPLN